MPDFTKFIGIGHLTRTPELSYTPQGTLLKRGLAFLENQRKETTSGSVDMVTEGYQ